MTWSIIARDAGGRFGVAIASRFFAVGALCLHTRSGVAALATQALVNPLYGPNALARLAAGEDAAPVLRSLLDADPGRELRQVHLVALRGAPVAHTGSGCVGWCGHAVHDDFSVAGNMLAGPEVIDETVRAYRQSEGAPLAERLLAAMHAGEAAGGDKRGRQSAALRVHAERDYPALDIRVDDHAFPLHELRRLYRISLERFQPFVACLATRDDPGGIIDGAEIELRVEAFQAALAAAAGRPT